MNDESSTQSPIFGNNIEGEEIMGRVILVAVVVLFMAVLFVLLFHLYARLFWWRVEQHLHRTQHRSQSDPGSTIIGRQRRRFIFVQGQDPSLSSGLDPSTLGSIPVVVFKPQDFKDGLECAVCLSDLVDGDNARLLPSCSHGFHVDCIDMWFQSHSTCPVCRNVVGSVAGISEHRDDGLSQNLHDSSQDPILDSGFSTEPPNFPTNVLVWGDQNQVSSVGLSVVEDTVQANSSNEHHQSLLGSGDGTAIPAMVVVEIPANPSECLPATTSTRSVEEESKSRVLVRLRSLKRLLSREKRVAACGSSSSGSTNV
ncbi:PREDICTED: RING-H2 finger protein ATL60 [Tarenaya hassleriana]|uniref:RING-H2 finger protein ATL60 n=1 Tax=Tarenaya hassleriana TaxID=28532 RepID=UPI00053CA578|nr:PREDICTED: RING-H2 finger protein ATL60 [Tarenaya hassleriana]